LPSGLEIRRTLDPGSAEVESEGVYLGAPNTEPVHSVNLSFDKAGRLGESTSQISSASGGPNGSFSSWTKSAQPRVTKLENFLPNTPWPSKVTEEADGKSIKSGLEYNEQGQTIQTSEPEDAGRTTDYNILGWPLRICRKNLGTPVCTELEYDKTGRVVRQKSPFGVMGSGQVTTTTLSYDSLGSLVRSVITVQPTASQLTESWEYDASGRLKRVDRTGAHAVELEYDGAGRLQLERTVGSSWGTLETTFTYDGDGRLLTTTDARSNVWSTEYDGFGRPMLQKDPLGGFVMTEYDDNHRPTRITECNPEGELLGQTTTEHDARGLLKKRITVTSVVEGAVAETAVEEFDYYGDGQPAWWMGPSGEAVVWEYDGFGRLKSQLQLLSDGPDSYHTEYWTEYEVDDRGRVSVERRKLLNTYGLDVPSEFVVDREYDPLDRMTVERNPSLGATRFVYDQQGNVAETIRPDQSVVVTEYDSLGRAIKVTRPNGIEMTYTHTQTGAGREVLMMDRKGNSTVWKVDGSGWLTQIVYPDGTSEGLEYDTVGNATKRTRRDGTVLDYSFDSLNRLDSIKEGEQVLESYTYDAENATRSVSASRGATLTTVHQDARGLPTLVKSDVGTIATNTFDVTSVYTPSGDARSTAYPSLPSVQRTFDSLGQVGEVSVDTTPLALYERLTPSTVGRRFSLTAPTVTWTPDNSGRPMEVSVDAGLETVYAEDLEWFPSGLLESRTLTEGEESRQINWQYDSARRLRTETSEYPAALLETVLGTSQTFQHDEAENLTGHTYASACGDVDRSFSIGTGNQLSGASFDWDLNGNLTSKGDLSLSYDHGDRLTKVEDDGVTVAEYQYDALGRRVLRTVDGVHYATVWDGWRPIEEYRFSLGQWFLTHRQFHGDRLDEVVHLEIMDGGVPTTYWPIYDTSGNLTVLLDGDHEPVEKYFYTPFGERWVWSRGEAPRVEQVRLTGDAVLIELSEQVHAS
ncbi:MAG: hypothetical protein MPN21_28265, partial [Thermoanaerobaculia bacterium]|nr:hypothetical protein [Thermoanaerobaculia bacterium]